jgi:uncharacterized protein (TIGR02996 family)
MSEEERFLRALIASPDDGALRAVYADWLEERGDPRAEFLRLETALLDSPPDVGPQRRWEELRAAYPGWFALVSTLGRPFRTGPQSRDFFDVEPASLPFTEAIGRRGRLVTFESQFRDARRWDRGLTADVQLLAGLPEGHCAYGAASIPMHPFLCEVTSKRRPLTGADVLAALKARDFNSRHIPTLDATRIPFPGYHPNDGDRIENDEIHNDYAHQHLFSSSHEDEGDGMEGPIDEFDGTHGLLKRSVVDGHLWYVLLHTTPEQVEEFRFSPYVVLFAVGLSLRGDRLIGVVTHQVCHNLCD